MSKVFLCVILSLLLLTGCSKNKDTSSEIEVEQVNPPGVIEQTTQQTDEPKPDVKIEDQIQQEATDEPKPESISINSKSSRKNIGKNVTVTGYVADVFKNAKVAYLNFDNKFPKNSFSAVIFKDEFSKFGDLNRFRDKTVEVSGIISEYKGKPQIILKSPSQVKIVN